MPGRVSGPSGPTSSQPPDSGGQTYTVKRGDTLSKIARQHNVPLQDLIRANPQIRDPNRIHPGQEIRIPDSTSSQPANQTPSSTPGDRFERVSQNRLSQLASNDPTIARSNTGEVRESRNYVSQSVDVTRDPAFQQLPQATRQRLTRAANDPQQAMSLQQVIQHPLYQTMNTQQRRQLLNVYAHADQRGREGLPDLMNRNVRVGSGNPPPTVPALLSHDNTSSQRTLLDHLDTLATQPLRPGLRNRRAQLLGDVINETGHPGWEIGQRQYNTCAPTTISSHLIQNTPAEYARVINGLAGPSAQVRMADGSIMRAAQNDIANPPTLNGQPDNRSLSERMFQSAIMQYAHQRPYNANTDQILLADGTTTQGLWDDQIARAMTGLYNRRYDVHPPSGTGIGNIVGQNMNQRQNLHNRIQQELNSGYGPVPSALLWGPPNANGTYGSHEILVERIENGRVYFRNPWGSANEQGSGYTDGTRLNNPPRRVEDAQGGIESMTIQDFQRHLDGAVLGPPVGGPR